MAWRPFSWRVSLWDSHTIEYCSTIERNGVLVQHHVLETHQERLNIYRKLLEEWGNYKGNNLGRWEGLGKREDPGRA